MVVTQRESSADLRRVRVRVEGIVQGVGFRPFVATVATGLELAGFVGNDATGVFVEAEGRPASVARLIEVLSSESPPLARVEQVHAEAIPPTGDLGFAVVRSNRGGERSALIAPDTATCPDCLTEIADPSARRFGYAFTNCTNCGPRLTIVRDVPYDRSNTTMAGFVMCADCRREYEDPTDRRFHAQPVCCPVCGPQLALLDSAGAARPSDPLAGAAALLCGGAVLAVKGLGGYHLAADATREPAVATLRARKHREDRPFALMVADVAAARLLAEVSDPEAALLTSPARPIVLLRRVDGAGVAPSVAPGQASLGLMLPYTPLHHLLLSAVGGPLVLTSGNVSDEPIAYADDDAQARLGGIADGFLTHDRPIHTRVDDSVLRVVDDRTLPVRRSRGFVPQPLTLPVPAARPVLACGPELKNTFCLARGPHAFVSHHIGDLENYETLRSFTTGIEHFRQLFDIAPAVIAHDLHPEYLSTKYAVELAERDPRLELVAVQHHHAHIASCLADNGAAGPVIGVAFDGLGMGTDGTLWGGEFLLADLASCSRAAHLEPVPMPGGAAAIRQPWRMAASYLSGLNLSGLNAPTAVATRQGRRWFDIQTMVRQGVNAPLTSSAGRLFDAVAALLGLRDEVTYEGQAAVELEQLADPDEPGAYRASLREGEPLQVRGTDLVEAALADLAAGVPAAAVSARFHNGVAELVVEVCRRLRESSGLWTVALSGGVFQNVLLLDRCRRGLAAAGFAVLTHHQVPPNDGGISLGQAAVVAARDRAAS